MNDRREIAALAKETLHRMNGALDAVVDVLECAIDNHLEALEYQDTTTEMLREQGSVRALRQLLNDI
ncbi:MAG: hypothetical protein RR014_07010, partial [Bilophila sp.]